VGIEFGDKAQVEIHGDMVGGSKITVTPDAWRAAASIIASGRMPLGDKEEATMSLSALRAELEKDEPNGRLVHILAEGLKRLAPAAFQVLVAAAPELVKLIPALVS